ncbi:MAG: acetate--CoA ligase family protein [Syntrophobacterales bacterium]|jgi:acetyltransferase|nr:acetate--CoA ligase family protein [Syntrophobacterales bacterium]
MRTFFYPEAVAVFGVSDTSSNLARIIVENLERFQFKGKVYPVGSREGTVAGRKIAVSLDSVEGIPDLAILLIPASWVPQALEECGRKGIRHAIVESGGFSEFSDERKTLEDEVREISGRWGIKVVGPNCFGVINLEANLVLPFFILNPVYMRSGHISLISQSGGILYDTCMLASSENIGLNKLVSVGNKLLTGENDCLEYLVSDPGTRAIGLYLESFSDGRRLIVTASATEKPVVLLKANRSPSGREIARFHTTALAGDNLIAQAAIKEAGIHQVDSLAEMMDVYKAFSLPLIKGKRLALIARSGGHGVLSGDAAFRYGFELAELSENFFTAAKGKKINVIRATNPLDVGDVYDLDSYSDILTWALEEKGVDGVVFVITYSSETDGVSVQRFLNDAGKKSLSYDKPVALCVVTNREQWLPIREAAGFPIFTDVDNALKALRRSVDHLESGPGRVAVASRLKGTRKPTVGLATASRLMSSGEAFALLEKYCLSIESYRVAKNIDDALCCATELGYPVAVKVESPFMLHKTENGGVALNVTDEDALRKTWELMKAKECLLQTMAPAGYEIIVGGRRDPEFGHALLFGLGGIFAEVFREPEIRLVPVDDDTAAAMIENSRAASVLKGWRGKPAADMAALRKTLTWVSRLLTEYPAIKNIDINPLIVYEDGKGATIVDVKMEIDL